MTTVHAPLESYRAHLVKITGMQDETWEVLKDVLNVVAVDKGEHILEEGKVCNHIYFLHEGSFRSYYNKDGEESTTGIFLSGMCFTNTGT
jgi:CRP-like cAMP-binding protein